MKLLKIFFMRRNSVNLDIILPERQIEIEIANKQLGHSVDWSPPGQLISNDIGEIVFKSNKILFQKRYPYLIFSTLVGVFAIYIYRNYQYIEQGFMLFAFTVLIGILLVSVIVKRTKIDLFTRKYSTFWSTTDIKDLIGLQVIAYYIQYSGRFASFTIHLSYGMFLVLKTKRIYLGELENRSQCLAYAKKVCQRLNTKLLILDSDNSSLAQTLNSSITS